MVCSQQSRAQAMDGDRVFEIEQCLMTARLHQAAFAEFKGKCVGKDVVVVATGPTLDRFRKIDGAVYIGVNRAFLRKDIHFDYMFAHDYVAMRSSMSELNEYAKGRCVKFYGMGCPQGPIDYWPYFIPESDVIAADARRYRLVCWPTSSEEMSARGFAYDLTTQRLVSLRSVVFAALQFALWTCPRRIYLVGCDCAGTGHFAGDATKCFADAGDLVDGYRMFKEFAGRYYPDTQIISINPVGLTGLFTDQYQE